MSRAHLQVEPIPCLQDNYCYLIRSTQTRNAWLVDPSEPEPPARVLTDQGLHLRGILVTHHHWDHVGGIEELVAMAATESPWVAGHAHDRGRIGGQTIFVDAPTGDYVSTELTLDGVMLQAMHIPGHTLGAIAWRIPAGDEQPADVFTGDTLFAAGCGRLFEGSPAQMFTSLRSLTKDADDTRLWFGHEYTAANLRFAAATEPHNEAVARRAERLGTPPTTPTTVALERATNPFVRSESVDELARRRAAKDAF